MDQTNQEQTELSSNNHETKEEPSIKYQHATPTPTEDTSITPITDGTAQAEIHPLIQLYMQQQNEEDKWDAPRETSQVGPPDNKDRAQRQEAAPTMRVMDVSSVGVGVAC